MTRYGVRKDKDGLYGLVEISSGEAERNRRHRAAETERAKSNAFLASWRARQPPSPARGHIPFPGHRHMGETG